MTRSWIAGIVAAAALAGATTGCKGKQTSEAEANLERLAAAVKGKFDRTGAFPSGRVGPTPPVSCCNQADKQCGDDPTAWQLPLWTEIGFSVTGKHKFVYTYEGSPTGYTATATGDLNCDGKASTFTLTGAADGKKVVTTWQKPTMLD